MPHPERKKKSILRGKDKKSIPDGATKDANNNSVYFEDSAGVRAPVANTKKNHSVLNDSKDAFLQHNQKHVESSSDIDGFASTPSRNQIGNSVSENSMQRIGPGDETGSAFNQANLQSS